MIVKRLAALALLAVAAGCGGGPVYRDPTVPLATVPAVDLTRYAGRWYEIARFPVSFQEGCVAVTADYDLRDDGRVDVLNACRTESFDGEAVTATAVARAADASGARLKVRFVPWLPFEGDYWIIHLDEDYRTAVVAVPSGSAGWILSRTPDIEPERLAPALAALEAGGYDLAALSFRPQPGGEGLPSN